MNTGRIWGRSVTIGTWTEDEHQRFLEGIEKYGKDWEKVATMVRVFFPSFTQIPTRTICQVRTHAQKYYSKLEKDVGYLAVVVMRRGRRPNYMG